MRESSIPISDEIQEGVQNPFFELGVVRTFIKMFQFVTLALHPFFAIAIVMLPLLTDLLQHSRINPSFLDCMVIVGSLPFWFWKPPRKPPDPQKLLGKSRDPILNKRPLFNLIVECFFVQLDPVLLIIWCHCFRQIIPNVISSVTNYPWDWLGLQYL